MSGERESEKGMKNTASDNNQSNIQTKGWLFIGPKKQIFSETRNIIAIWGRKIEAKNC